MNPRIQIIEPTRDGPREVSHPREILVNIHWKDKEDPTLDDLEFDFHSTSIIPVGWGMPGDKHRMYLDMGYCSECGILFIIEPEHTTFSDWHIDEFKRLFDCNDTFREKILKDAGG